MRTYVDHFPWRCMELIVLLDVVKHLHIRTQVRVMVTVFLYNLFFYSQQTFRSVLSRHCIFAERHCQVQCELAMTVNHDIKRRKGSLHRALGLSQSHWVECMSARCGFYSPQLFRVAVFGILSMLSPVSNAGVRAGGFGCKYVAFIFYAHDVYMRIRSFPLAYLGPIQGP